MVSEGGKGREVEEGTRGEREVRKLVREEREVRSGVREQCKRKC